MQSSLEFFCEECGAANAGHAAYCIACQEPLSHSLASLPAPVQPVVITPPPTLQVMAGIAPTTPSEALVASEHLKPGMLLQNRYRIEGEIGQGGYSVVYKAVDTEHRKRPVTIKQINLHNLTSRQIIEATETFNRETLLLPLLRHESIPKFYSHFTDPEHWYLVMEYIPGQTLEEYLQDASTGGSCSVEETLKIGIVLSATLEYLHFLRPSVIFRDVKPANIMLTPRKKVYLIDFGIARFFQSNKAKDTTPLGSPGFAAPEQYGRAQSDQRTDIYGLGATLQTLLTGRDPQELRAGEPSRQSEPIPLRVQKLLAEMMDPDPSRRPRQMTTVKDGLQRALAQTRYVFYYFLGLILGVVFVLLSAMIFGLSSSYGSPLYDLFIPFACLGALATLSGFFTLLIFLFIPGKRYITFGVLTVVLTVFLLYQLYVAYFLRI